MSTSRQTVLLVEDRSDDVLLLQRVLKRTDSCRLIHVARTGEEAIAYLDGKEDFADRNAFPLPGLIFLDLKLPAISGFEVLAWIRQQPRFDRIQIIVLTGSRHSIDVYRAFELGANSFLAKPVDPAGLANALKTLNVSWLPLQDGPRPVVDGGVRS